jgi:hypothetical protein
MGEAGLQCCAHRSRMRHITMYNRLKQESTWSFAASDADVATGYRGAVFASPPAVTLRRRAISPRTHEAALPLTGRLVPAIPRHAEIVV